MAKIYTLVNQKGGVGKTTTAINLGAYLGQFNQRVLLVDLDPQANATSSLGIDKRSIQGGTYDALLNNPGYSKFILHNPKIRISMLPASPALAGAEVELVDEEQRQNKLMTALRNIQDRYDYILIDCPPSLGMLTLNGIVAAADGLIIPVQCEYLALEGLGQLTQTIQLIQNAYVPKLRIRGVVLTMFDARTNLSTDVVAEVRKFFQERVFNSIIPRTIRLAEAPSFGQPISLYSPGSTGAIAYRSLAAELLRGDGIMVNDINLEPVKND